MEGSLPDRRDIENRIVKKLRVLSPVELQWLAEDIALVRDPERYRGLYGKGRNAEAQTTKGWPDAGVVQADGTVDGVEATRDKTSWTEHLNEDLSKAKSPDYPKLNGYLFVAGYPDHDPGFDKIGFWKAKFVDLDLPEERVDLLVGTALVNELLSPRFARTRKWILGLDHQPRYFNLVQHEPVGGRYLFSPTPDEYKREQVHRPALADDVEERLREDGCALVRGRGAAGKTVLAQLIALGREYRFLPSYYLNLAPWADQVEHLQGDVENTLVEFGGQGVLFIVDNVHLTEDFVAGVLGVWQESAKASGTRLLLVGREVRRAFKRSALAETSLDPLVLRARADEVRGVYRRLALRELPDGATLPRPPERVVREWVERFGDDPGDPEHSVDLMALSAAAQNRMNFLLREEWDLSYQDAREEVRQEYLTRLSTAERSNLLRLAALPEDAPLPREAMVDTYVGLDECVRKGLVFETVHGDRRYVRYSLVHSALGKLLWTAAQPRVDRTDECCEVARRSPFSGFWIARCALEDNEEYLAQRVLEAIRETRGWLARQPGLRELPGNLATARQFGIHLLPDEVEALSAERTTFLELAFETPVHFLVTFLKYANASGSELSAVQKNLVEDLAEPAHRHKWLGLALKTPLHFLVAFLKYAQTSESGLSTVQKNLVEDLAVPVHRDKLHKRVLKTPLDSLVTFLDYAQTPQSGFPAADEHFARRMVESIDLATWNRQRAQEVHQQPHLIVNLGTTLSKLERPELAVVPARTLVREADPATWHSSNVGIRHVSNAITWAAGAAPEHLDRFLRQVTTPEWLARQYRAASLGAIAGACLALATHVPSNLHSKFHSSTLRERLDQELRAIVPSGESEGWATMLSALGSASVLGVCVSPGFRGWLSNCDLASVIALRTATEKLGFMQVQFWCGLREMARLRQDCTRVPQREGAAVLELWREASPPTEYAAALNEAMIAWLEKCQADGWLLDGQVPAIHDDIVRRIGT